MVDVRLPPEGSDALTGVEMFAGLEPAVRQRVIAATVPYSYRKGQVLFEQDDPGDSLIVLKRGAVAFYRTSPAGETTAPMRLTCTSAFSIDAQWRE